MKSKTEQFEACGFNWPFHRIKSRLRIFKQAFCAYSESVYDGREEPVLSKVIVTKTPKIKLEKK